MGEIEAMSPNRWDLSPDYVGHKDSKAAGNIDPDKAKEILSAEKLREANLLKGQAYPVEEKQLRRESFSVWS